MFEQISEFEIEKTLGAFLIAIAMCIAIGDYIGMAVVRLSKAFSENAEDTESLPTVEGQHLFGGRSKCTHCGHQLSVLENLPIVSWLALKGKSKCCQQKLPKIYPLTEITFGIVGAIGFYYLTPFALFLFITAFAICYTATLIDLKHYCIPTEGNIALLLIAVIMASFNPQDLSEKFLIALIAWALIHVVNSATKMVIIGEGDIPIILAIFLISSGSQFNMALLLTTVITILIFAYKMIVLRQPYGEARIVPFGPGLCIAFLVLSLYVLTDPLLMPGL